MVTAVQMMMTTMMTKMQQPPRSRLSPCNGALTLGLELVEPPLERGLCLPNDGDTVEQDGDEHDDNGEDDDDTGLDWWW